MVSEVYRIKQVPTPSFTFSHLADAKPSHERGLEHKRFRKRYHILHWVFDKSRPHYLLRNVALLSFKLANLTNFSLTTASIQSSSFWTVLDESRSRDALSVHCQVRHRRPPSHGISLGYPSSRPHHDHAGPTQMHHRTSHSLLFLRECVCFSLLLHCVFEYQFGTLSRAALLYSVFQRGLASGC